MAERINMDIMIAIAIILFTWFLLGFIAFLISAKHDKCYTEFDDSARHDLLFYMELQASTVTENRRW